MTNEELLQRMEDKTSYNSCRNGHCTKCQTISKEKWIFYSCTIFSCQISIEFLFIEIQRSYNNIKLVISRFSISFGFLT